MLNTPARIEARDRRLAAIHEAAHVVIARHVGSQAVGWIFRQPVADPKLEKTWIGKATQWGALSRPRTTMVGVAGAVGEAIWDGESDYLQDFDVWHEPEIMSDTDWSLTGCTPGKPDGHLMRAVFKVTNLLAGPLRADLYTEARRLIVNAAPTAFMYAQ